MSYLLANLPRFSITPQSQPIPGSNQKQNNAGGFAWEVDDMTRLRRFICLGSEGGSYYVKEKELTAQNIGCISRLIEGGRGKEVVEEIVKYSVEGRTAKQDPILLALAMCIRSTNQEVKSLAYQSLEKICRIPTHLFGLIQFVEALDPHTTGWGRGLRTAVSRWYNEKEGRELAFTVTKYRQRNGWSHRDLLRLAHVKPRDDAHQLVFKYITKGGEVLPNYEEQPKKVEDDFDLCDHPAPVDESVKETLEFLRIVEEVSKLGEEQHQERLCELIRKFRLAREHLPTTTLNSPQVWECLMQSMPMTAMIRNLAKMTSIGVLQDGNKFTRIVVDKLNNPEELRKARVHPFSILLALKVYSQGRGEKGSLTWNPLTAITKAMDGAFYKAFKNVEATGQNVVIGMDVSGSMSQNVLGSECISCREAAMAMAMVMANTEPSCRIMAFTDTLVPVPSVKPSNTLEANLQAISRLPFGGTDCALPITWALEKKIRAQTFIVYTDNETWAGRIHPSEALRKYRREMNEPEAKLIVVGMSVGQFSIADPADRGMLDVAGFDANAPEVMRNFMLGLI